MTLRMIYAIDTFIDTLEKYNFVEKFNDVEVYVWSNFPFKPTRDIDLMFIGEPTNELGEKIKDFKNFAKEQCCLSIDEQVFEDTRVFRYIEEYNRLGVMNFEDISKYKLVDINSPRTYKNTPVKINEHFWKFELKGMNEKNRSRSGRMNLHYPILIQDFIQLVFNIKNPEIYNTKKDSNWKGMIKELKRFARLIKDSN